MLKVGAIKVLLILGISSLKDSVGPEPGHLSLFCEPGLGIHVATRTVICFRSGKPLVTEHSEGLSLLVHCPVSVCQDLVRRSQGSLRWGSSRRRRAASQCNVLLKSLFFMSCSE